MTIIVRSLTLLALFTSVPAFAQESQHDQHQAQKEAASAKPATTKCCEGMDKMGEMKGSMPMKGEMKGDMKAKMEEMKKKVAEKMSENGMKTQKPETKAVKSQSNQAAH